MKLVIAGPVLVPTINKRGSVEFNGTKDGARKGLLISYLESCFKYNINPENRLTFTVFSLVYKIKGIIS